MAVKKLKKKKHTDADLAKVVIALMILLLASGIFLIFKSYYVDLVVSGNLKSFMFLVVVGMGFLVGLLYLVSQPHTQKKKKAR